MTFDIGLNEVCVRVGVRYVITKFSGMDSLPNFLTHGAPLRERGSSASTTVLLKETLITFQLFIVASLILIVLQDLIHCSNIFFVL